MTMIQIVLCVCAVVVVLAVLAVYVQTIVVQHETERQ
jgi:hypothetical protein